MAVTRFPHKRRTDWTQRFSNFMQSSRQLASDLKLDWQYVSCASWTGDMVEAITGHNPHDLFSREYTSALAAARVVKEAGYQDLDSLLRDLFEEVPVSMLQDGDIFLAPPRWSADGQTSPVQVMPHAITVANPPFYWCVNPEGLSRGDLYGVGGFGLAVGRSV